MSVITSLHPPSALNVEKSRRLRNSSMGKSSDMETRFGLVRTHKGVVREDTEERWEHECGCLFPGQADVNTWLWGQHLPCCTCQLGPSAVWPLR